MPTVALLDLNGTLTQPIRHPDEAPLQPIGGALDALLRLHQAGIRTSIVTVQGRIGRGLFTEDQFRRWVTAFSDRVREHGGLIHSIHLCPHLPAVRCACRKPATLLYEQALRQLDAAPADAWIVGDTSNDIIAANTLGSRAILVRTGHGAAAQHDRIHRDAVVDTVTHAAQHIIAAGRQGELTTTATRT